MTGHSDPNDGPRSVRTVEDVEAILEGPATFAEVLDCVAVASSAARWNLVERCLPAAFASVDASRQPKGRLAEVARAYLTARLASVRSLRGIAGTLEDAAEALRDLEARVDHENHRSALRDRVQEARELALLIADDDVPSLVSLSSRLRAYVHRPDLAVIAATKALQRDAGNAKALTTRGAANVDMERYDRARVDLEAAWETAPAKHSALARYRCELRDGRHREALHWALEASSLAPDDSYGLHALAAAAVACGDQDLLSSLRPRLESMHGEARDDRWVTFVAARQLVRDGAFDLARETLTSILETGPYAPASRLLEQIGSSGGRPGRPEEPSTSPDAIGDDAPGEERPPGT